MAIFFHTAPCCSVDTAIMQMQAWFLCPFPQCYQATRTHLGRVAELMAQGKKHQHKGYAHIRSFIFGLKVKSVDN